MKKFINIMKERGFLHQTALDDDTNTDVLTAYIGFDLTAQSLHVGSLIQLMVLKHLSMLGHKPIVLIGDATTKVGDPSGKDTSRPMLSDDAIASNANGIRKCITNIVPEAEVVSNSEWFNDDMSFMSFMTQHGPHFTINRMMTFDSVKTRLERSQPLTMLEFSYMLMQAVDFLELSKRGVNMQIGGSDQWGNIINGVELVRREKSNKVMAFTTPLLLDSTGKKMGKSQGKPVWLSADMTPPSDFFQFWRNVDDADVERFLKLFTFISIPEIDAIINRDINQAKKILALEVCKIVHGEKIANQTLAEAQDIFENGNQQATSRTISANGLTLVEAIVIVDESLSKSAARRLLSQNAVSVDGLKVLENITMASGMVIKVGKRHPVKVT